MITKIPKELQALTKKQQTFVLEYAKTGNGTQSARLAGYKGADKVLGIQAVRLLGKASIKTAIDLLVNPPLAKEIITTERVIQEITKYALEEPSNALSHNDKRGYLKMLGDHKGAWKEPDNPFGKGVKSISVKFE